MQPSIFTKTVVISSDDKRDDPSWRIKWVLAECKIEKKDGY